MLFGSENQHLFPNGPQDEVEANMALLYKNICTYANDPTRPSNVPIFVEVSYTTPDGSEMIEQSGTLLGMLLGERDTKLMLGDVSTPFATVAGPGPDALHFVQLESISDLMIYSVYHSDE